jgi:hypothetical protein
MYESFVVEKDASPRHDAIESLNQFQGLNLQWRMFCLFMPQVMMDQVNGKYRGYSGRFPIICVQIS